MKKELGKRPEKGSNTDFLAQRNYSGNYIVSNYGCLASSSKSNSRVGTFTLNKVLLLLDKNDTKSLISIIDGEQDIGVISLIFDSLLWRDKKLLEGILRKVNLDELVRKIDREEDLNKINFLVSRVSWLGRETNCALFGKMGLSSIARKIDCEGNLDTVCDTLFNFYVCGEDAAKKLLEEISFETLLAKVANEQDSDKIAMLIYHIYLVCQEFSEKIAKIVRNKIKYEESLEKITELLFKIRLLKSKFEGKLHLLDMKKREQGQEDYGETCLNFLSQSIDTEMLHSIAKGIDLEDLATKINLEQNFQKIFELITEISKLSKETSIELLSKTSVEHLVLKYEKNLKPPV
ncbi:MAG: hypothetical protein KIH09_01830 [Candidatus Freyarchaeota archaeon]|nr:hypothetical protein [Candidatus Jordarchaeia archaeon]